MGLGFHYYLLELTKGRRGRGGGEGKVLSRLPLPDICIERKVLFISTCREPGRRDRGWERAAAPGSSGDQTALDSSILLLPGRVLMWRESSLKPWASLSASRCPVQAKVPSGWLSVAVRSVRQKFITIIFSPIFFFVRAVGRK